MLRQILLKKLGSSINGVVIEIDGPTRVNVWLLRMTDYFKYNN